MIGCSRPTRQAPRPFAVPSGLHALRSDPDDAGSQVASADAAFLPYAAGATAVRRCFRTGLTNEGSHEAVRANSKTGNIAGEPLTKWDSNPPVRAPQWLRWRDNGMLKSLAILIEHCPYCYVSAP